MITSQDDGHALGPEWKGAPEGAPDRYLLMKGPVGNQVGIEWYTAGKRIDLSRETTGLPRRTLVQLDGDARPRFLVGGGRMIDIATSIARGELVALDSAAALSASPDTKFEVTIGDPIWADEAAVTRVLQEDTDSGHVAEAEEEVLSPFDGVIKTLNQLPNSTDRINKIIEQDPELAWLLGH